MDQIWPNEGLLNVLLSLIFGTQNGSGSPLLCDLINVNIGLTGPQAKYANMAFTTLSSQTSATSGLLSGNNILQTADFTVSMLVGNQLLLQPSGPITFTNIIGIDVQVLGWAIYMTGTMPPIPNGTGPNLLMNYQFYDAPINLPAGGTILVTPTIGDNSLLTS